MSSLKRISAAFAAALLAACGASPAPDAAKAGSAAQVELVCSLHSDERLAEMTDVGIGLTSSLGLAAGRYALPADAKPTSLVVMFHGHGNDSCGWRRHLLDAAAHGAVAVAMDYTGQRQEPWENYGWFAREGAADSIAAARYFLAKYPSITNVIAFAVSMGGNVGGVAVYSPEATRADGAPLWDWFVDIEGVNNLTEEYLIARGIAPGVPAGGQAQQEIEEENGGALEDVPEKYAEITNVLHAADMHVKGVALVNGVDDGLVPTNQSDEMARALDEAGVPAHTYKVLLNGGAESGTTATAIPLDPIAGGAGQTYESPFAGHAWEGSDTHLVMKQGLSVLYDLLAGGTIQQGYSEDPGL